MIEAAGRCSPADPRRGRDRGGLRARGVRIGSGTGYTRGHDGRDPAAAPPRRAMRRRSWSAPARRRSGRPSPLMTWQALIELDAWPARLSSRSTTRRWGSRKGRAAGCWTVGVAASGNGVGLSRAELQALPEPERRARIDRATQSLAAAGAHLVIDSVADLPSALSEIERRLAAGANPWN